MPQQQETKIIPFKEDVNHLPIFIKLVIAPMFYKSECGLQRQDYVRARHREDGAGMGWELCAEDPLQKQVYFVLGVRVIRVGREEPLLPRLGLHRGWHSFPTYTPMLMPPSALILDVFIFQTDIQRVNRVCFHSWKPLDLSGEREKACAGSC